MNYGQGNMQSTWIVFLVHLHSACKHNQCPRTLPCILFFFIILEAVIRLCTLTFIKENIYMDLESKIKTKLECICFEEYGGGPRACMHLPL